MIYIENNQITAVYHLLVADLIGPLGVTTFCGTADLNSIVIDREVFLVVS